MSMSAGSSEIKSMVLKHKHLIYDFETRDNEIFVKISRKKWRKNPSADESRVIGEIKFFIQPEFSTMDQSSNFIEDISADELETILKVSNSYAFKTTDIYYISVMNSYGMLSDLRSVLEKVGYEIDNLDGKYCLEKDRFKALLVSVCVCVFMGFMISLVNGNRIIIGVSVGLVIGVCLGVMAELREDKRRAEAKRRRYNKRQ